MQLSTALRNARANLIESTIGTSAKLLIFSGAKPTNVSDSDPAGLLGILSLPSDWMGASSGGVTALAGTWSGTAIGTGSPLSYRIKDSTATSTPDTGTTYIQGVCGVGSGELSANGTITSGQTLSITSYGFTEGNV